MQFMAYYWKSTVQWIQDPVLVSAKTASWHKPTLWHCCCCCPVAQPCLTLWKPTGCSMSDLPVPHHLPKFAQVHVHCISDALHPSPLMPSTPSALNLFYHQRLFQWVSCLHQMIKILDLQLQHQSFQWIFRTDFLSHWLIWSPCSPRDSQESSPTLQFQNILSHCFMPTRGGKCGRSDKFPLLGL